MTAVQSLRSFPPVDLAIEPPERLSQTLLGKHDNCPRSAYLYLKYGGGTPSHAMMRGTALHEVVERLKLTMVEQGEWTIPGDVAAEMADAVMVEHPEWVLRAEDQDVVRLCAYNWAEATALDLDAIVAVELPMHLELAGWTLSGRIDHAEAAGQTAYLRDLKTSLAIRKKEEVERGWQGKFYALLFLFGVHAETGLPMGGGINDVFFYEEYPRYRTEEGPLFAREAAWTRPEIFEFKNSLERNILAFERSLETGDWPALDGSWCSECPAQQECPIPAHLRQVHTIESDEDAADAFSQMLALEREKSRYQTALRERVKETERPVYLGDYAFDATKTESRTITDLDEFVTIAYRIVDHEISRDSIDLSSFIEKRTSTKFAKRKLTKEERDAA